MRLLVDLLTYGLALYFALTLGVAGIVKLDGMRQFALTLRDQNLLPSWSISFVHFAFPWFEIGLAVLLTFEIYPIIVASLVVVIFLVFLTVTVTLYMRGSEAGCGCTGRSTESAVDGASIISALILVSASVIYLWLAFQTHAIDSYVRLACSSIFLGLAIYLIIMTQIRKLRPLDPSLLPPPEVGGLPIGVKAPDFRAWDNQSALFQLSDFMGRRLILAFVAPGCPSCSGALAALSMMFIWDMMPTDAQDVQVLVIGGPDQNKNTQYADELHVALPIATPEAGFALATEIYGARGFPTFFALDEAGVIRSRGLVNCNEHLVGLLRQAYGLRLWSHFSSLTTKQVGREQAVTAHIATS